MVFHFLYEAIVGLVACQEVNRISTNRPEFKSGFNHLLRMQSGASHVTILKLGSSYIEGSKALLPKLTDCLNW